MILYLSLKNILEICSDKDYKKFCDKKKGLQEICVADNLTPFLKKLLIPFYTLGEGVCPFGWLTETF